MNIFKIIKFVFMIVVLFIIFYILTANTASTTIKIFPFPSFSVTYPLSFILFMAFFTGIMLAGIYAAIEGIKQSSKIKKLTKQNTLLEREIENLRKEPIIDDSIDSDDFSGETDDYSGLDNPIDEETLDKIR